ncbi:hypothetical protein PC9H_005211 [Pleurotus ostreatus]|uniref:Peptidase S54 rhomboid domain-containing protein n=1 Tax=Pleurotus ostreatus TaxID=5322 RepID=A0A8H6ZZ53_PLEOS|nr:uncharacterized protein PC9H_005211 [Pleurotus ostreatus]KAF7433261.1 hypothetical protein PC9H_005211 [Pleurotus ostreatus]KAJ8698075.1 hypothetical protein PTI98_004827 [Pleurotus ostreatus]
MASPYLRRAVAHCSPLWTPISLQNPTQRFFTTNIGLQGVRSVPPLARSQPLSRPSPRISDSARSIRLYSWRRYTAPPRKHTFLDRIPHDYIIYGILAANGIVFGMWYLADVDYKTGDPSSLLWMRDNFTMSMRNVTNSRPWVLVTSIFSHSGMAHILFNCFAFYCVAPPVLGMLGGRSFLTLYFAGGIFANLVSSTYNKVFKGRDMQSVGASAAIYSAVTYLACAAPRTTFYLYAVIPIPAWLLVPAILGFDMWSWVSNRETTTDSLGHVGGILAGAAYFLGRRFGIFRF